MGSAILNRRFAYVYGVAIPAVALAMLLACAPQATAPAGPSGPSVEPVRLTYLGVAGWRVDDGDHVLLVDPYFTRLHVDQASPTPLLPDPALIARYAPTHADAILVGHSHYDHLLDVPDIARRTGATIVGTDSTLRVAAAAGISGASLRRAQGGETFAFGPFSVRVFRGLHSLLGLPPTAIPPGVTLPLPASGYTEGGTLDYLVRVGNHAILFIGSANFIESEIEGLRPDVAILAVGLREKIPDYSCRLMRALGQPPLVLTNHFDAHWEALGPDPMKIGDEARANLAKFADEIHACAPATRVVVPTHRVPFSL
jgi:L-ascorbate metabolism protein UlaG (beta-lactamase superfamily)